MDMEFKRLLLLSMRMNDANKLVLKVSPKKVINLQFYASVSFCHPTLIRTNKLNLLLFLDNNNLL